MTALLSTLLPAIIPILLKCLSDMIGQPREQKEKRDDLKALNQAKTGVDVAVVWQRHDNDIERLLLKAKAHSSKR